jgi:hypothetical protein
MSVLEEAAQETLKPGGKCSVTRWRNRLSAGTYPVTLADFDELMASELEASVVARYLLKRGVEVRDQAVRRHKRGDCKCP